VVFSTKRLFMAFQAKRKYTRKTGREAVKILSQRGVEYATFEDISAGGLKLWMDRSIEAGEVMQVEFLLPYVGHGRHLGLEVDAQVVRCIKRDKAFEVGVKFLRLSDSEWQQLETAVDCTKGSF